MAIPAAPLPNFRIAQPDVLANMGKMVALKNMLAAEPEIPLQIQQQQQGVQAAQLENQQRELQMRSQQAMVSAWSDPNFLKEIAPAESASAGQGSAASGNQDSMLGFDPNAMTAALIKRGVLPNQAMALVGQFVDRSAKVSEAAKNNAAATADSITSYSKGLDQLTNSLAPILDMPAAKAGDALASLKQQLATNPPPGLTPAEVQMVSGASLEQLPAVMNMLGLEGRLADYHLKQIQVQTQSAAARKGGIEAREAEAGRTPQQETARYIQIKQAEAMGQEPSKGDAAFAKAYEENKTLGQRYLIQSGGNLSAGALDDLATMYHETGQLPQTGYGAAGTAMRAAIINHAHEMFGDQQLAQNSAAYKANQASLDNLQKMYDQVNAFENTAGKNLSLFLDSAQKIVDSGSPWINTPLRAVSEKGLGSGDLAAFNAARQTAVNEIAKVLNSSNASGVLSDQARKEVNDLIGPNATFRQVVSASRILQQDMQNRHDSYQEQIQDIKSRLAPASTSAATAPAAATAGTVTMRAPNGQTKAVPADQVDHFKSLGATVVNAASQ